MALKVVQFFAVILTALALVPAGAHFFELPNKIELAQDHYFIVQNIYRGWALFGIVVVPARRPIASGGPPPNGADLRKFDSARAPCGP
jgi:hypothetical protein